MRKIIRKIICKIMRKIVCKIMEAIAWEITKPPFTITDKMISYISSISEKIGRITVTSSLVSKPHLRKNNQNSNRYILR